MIQSDLVWNANMMRHMNPGDELSIFNLGLDYTAQPVLLIGVVSNKVINKLKGGIFRFAWGQDDQALSHQFYGINPYEIKHNNEYEFKAILYKNYIFTLYENQIFEFMVFDQKLEGS